MLKSKIRLLILETATDRIKDLKKYITRPAKTYKTYKDIFQHNLVSKSLKGLCCKEIKNHDLNNMI